MQGNRENYCRRVRQALDLIRFPQDILQLQDALNDDLMHIDLLGKDVQRNILVLKEFFAHETSAVNREIDVLQHAIMEMKKELDASAYNVLEQIHTEFEIYHKNRKECDDIKRTISLLKADDAELGKKQQKVEERIATTQASSEYRSGKEFMDEKRKLEDERDEALRPYAEAISTLQLALKKYAYAGKGDDLLKRYEDDPITTLGQDQELKLLETLSIIEQEIKDGTLPLKDKKSQKSLEAAEMLKEHLPQFQLKLHTFDERLHQVGKRLTQNVAFLNLSEQEKFLQVIAHEREAIAERIKEHEHDLSVKDPSLALRSLEQLLSGMGDMKISIVQ